MTLESTLEALLHLSPEQQDALLDIVRQRRMETRLQDWSIAAEETLAAYRRGEIRALSAEEAIAQLRREAGDHSSSANS